MGMFDSAPDTSGSESPFNPSGDLGESVGEVQPIPVGVMRGHVAEAKKTKTGKTVVSIQCDDPNYSQTDEVALFPQDVQMLGQIGAALGVVVTQKGRDIYLQDSNGKTGLAALNGKAGLFVFAPYLKDGLETASISKFGLPKPKSSELWDAYMEQSNFSEAQIDAIKKARGGVVLPEHHHLFIE